VEITDALGRTRKLQYDELGNVLAAIDPLGPPYRFRLRREMGQASSITR